RIVKLCCGSLQTGRLQQRDEFLRAARLAVERAWKACEVLISPGCGNAEAGMNQHKRRAAQGRKEIEGLDLFTASGRQRRPGLEEEGDIGTEAGGDSLQLSRRERSAEEFVQAEQCRGRVAAAA